MSAFPRILLFLFLVLGPRMAGAVTEAFVDAKEDFDLTADHSASGLDPGDEVTWRRRRRRRRRRHGPPGGGEVFRGGARQHRERSQGTRRRGRLDLCLGQFGRR